MSLFRKPSLTREKVEQLKFEAMIVRNERRLAEAKENLARRGIVPRVNISGAWVPFSVARTFSRGL